MSRVYPVAFILFAFVLCGCEKKFDASSDESLRYSTEQMTKSMDEPTKQKFEQAVAAVMFDIMSTPGVVGNPDAAHKQVMERLNNKTAAEIMAEGDKVRAAGKK